MKKKPMLFLSLLILCMFTFALPSNKKEPATDNSMTVTAQTGIDEGQLAPNFKLKSINGQIVQLSDYRGQKVVLNFWASWCPPCKVEIPVLNEYYMENKNKNITILSINMTYAEKNKKTLSSFLDMYRVNYPILLDESGDIAELYGIITIPTTYFIDSNGFIQKRIIGPVQKPEIEGLIKMID